MQLHLGFRTNVSVFLISLIILISDCLCKVTIEPNYKLLPRKSGTVEGKIVKGTAVPIEKFASAAMVIIVDGLCGGSILNSWTVLTAAHCFDFNNEVDYISVHVASRYKYDVNGQIHQVAYLHIHDDYRSPIRFANDVALLFLTDPIIFGERAKKAIIVDTDVWMNTRETNFSVTGWGRTWYEGDISTKGLLMTHLKFVTTEKCGKLHNMQLTPDMFCLYGDAKTDVCSGDSGGGVLWNDQLVGIVSHGMGCAWKDKPSVYANVLYFRNWIESHVNAYVQQNCKV